MFLRGASVFNECLCHLNVSFSSLFPLNYHFDMLYGWDLRWRKGKVGKMLNALSNKKQSKASTKWEGMGRKLPENGSFHFFNRSNLSLSLLVLIAAYALHLLCSFFHWPLRWDQVLLERGTRWLLTKADTRNKKRISPASQEMMVSIRVGGWTSKGKENRADEDSRCWWWWRGERMKAQTFRTERRLHHHYDSERMERRKCDVVLLPRIYLSSHSRVLSSVFTQFIRENCFHLFISEFWRHEGELEELINELRLYSSSTV